MNAKFYKSNLATLRMDPDSIAEIYWQTANQPKNCWTFELDVRPWVEKW